MILEKEILDSLQRVGSFDDINKIIYRCEEKAELNQIDVLPFAKAYAALLMNSDAFFSGEEEKSLLDYVLIIWPIWIGQA